MYIVRPICLDDLDGLFSLSREAHLGIASLPADKEKLKEKILKSVESFEKNVKKPEDELYMFVLVDNDNVPVGVSAIKSNVQGHAGFKIETEELKFLHDVLEYHELVGHASEVCTLYLSRNARGYGKLLSLSRYLYVAQNPKRFHDNIIAQMRGVIENNAKSPFWDVIGFNVFGETFRDAIDMYENRSEELKEGMPKKPIYIDFLPQTAQEVIGNVHENTAPARKMLIQQGFKFSNVIDLTDAGPLYTCPTTDIKTIKDSVVMKAEEGGNGVELALVCSLEEFKCGLCKVEETNKSILIDNNVFGDKVRYCILE